MAGRATAEGTCGSAIAQACCAFEVESAHIASHENDISPREINLIYRDLYRIWLTWYLCDEWVWWMYVQGER